MNLVKNIVKRFKEINLGNDHLNYKFRNTYKDCNKEGALRYFLKYNTQFSLR